MHTDVCNLFAVPHALLRCIWELANKFPMADSLDAAMSCCCEHFMPNFSFCNPCFLVVLAVLSCPSYSVAAVLLRCHSNAVRILSIVVVTDPA